ncbi:hypothetical protein PIB30_039715 [Stylosanthes scabra]|uniref:Uncharacterized protein n=1 Tax=Stylosanthes scabra TaxID=79078 RepID=A0ABU6ZD33_9FABA|nr:hypothetical protein [Stylosanthes scabra]
MRLLLCGNDAKQQVQNDEVEEMHKDDMAMFNTNPDFSESPLEQSNYMASYCERNKVKKSSSSKAAKDAKIFKDLIETLKFIGVEKSMRKAKKNIGSKNGLKKACKSGDFTKKEECDTEKRSYSHRIGAKLDSLER